jgi:glycine dehydrogenase subunit 2
MKLIFDKSVPGRHGVLPPTNDVPNTIHIKKELLRNSDAALPELSELDVVRHFTELSQKFRRRYQFLSARLMHDEV